MRGAILAAAVAGIAMTAAPPPRRPEEGETFAGGVPIDPADRDPIPDRVSLEQDSPHFFAGYPMLGVKVNGRESTQIVEFCKSEGWARLCLRDHRGRMKRDSSGRPLTTTVSGTIQPYWRDQPIPDVAVVRPAAEVAAEREAARTGERPAVSREVARRLRQQAAKEAKAAARQR